jgi:hypothetical protein
MVEAIRYKTKRRKFESRRGHWIFFLNVSVPSNYAVTLEFTQSLIEILLEGEGGKVRLELKADNRTAICELIV